MSKYTQCAELRQTLVPNHQQLWFPVLSWSSSLAPALTRAVGLPEVKMYRNNHCF